MANFLQHTPRRAILSLSAAILLCAAPARAEQLLVASPSGLLTSVHPVTGEVVGLQSSCTSISSMVMDGDLLRVGDEFGNIFMYDYSADSMGWLFTLSSDCVGLGVWGTELIVADTDGEILRVDKVTGQIISTLAVEDWLQISSLITDGSVVYVGTTSGLVLRKDLATAEDFQFWGTCTGPVTSMTQTDTHVLMADPGGNISKVDKITQSVEFLFGAGGDGNSLAIHQNDIMMISADGMARRLDIDDARQHLEQDLGFPVSAMVTRDDSQPGLPYCYGESCPCGNDDASAGCANSLGVGGWLRGSGSTSVTSDDLVLYVSNVPAGRFGVMFMCGDLQQGPPMGDGLLCTGGQGGYRRMGTLHSGVFGFFDQGGLVQFSHDSFGSNGAITDGSTWVFQMWYRDEVGPCGSGFNTTNAYSVLFTP